MVYMGQSSEKQVQQNIESQRLQYELAERIRGLGWQEIEIINSDLGAATSIPSVAIGAEVQEGLASALPPPKILQLEIEQIRTDGNTQHRCVIDGSLVRQYAELLARGTQLPPVSVWYDGADYWLSDGFHRLAAAQQLNWRTIGASIRNGSLNDAQWDSYRANSDHGLRRTRRELEAVVMRAIKHPRAAQLSNVEIAKHLNMPEATLRRWRKRLSSSSDEDSTRVVRRGTSTYAIDTARIGRTRRRKTARSLMIVASELAEMKERGSPEARRFFSVLSKWIQGAANIDDCLRAIETIVEDLKGQSFSCSAKGRHRGSSPSREDKWAVGHQNFTPEQDWVVVKGRG
jgi:hypothetical protein